MSLLCWHIPGINPQSLRGTNTGVYMGQMHNDAHDILASSDEITGYEMSGCSRAMLANRLSYTFDLRGQSIIMSVFNEFCEA